MTRLLVLLATLVCVLPGFGATAFAFAASQDPPPAGAPVEAEPPAHVSLVDGVAVLERDGQIDDDPANMPLLAGDRVRTRAGRVEILFADGGTLHLDEHTTVDFQSDELVRLLDGRIRLSIPGPLRAVSYRIDAPSGWAEISQPGEYRLALLRNNGREELELAVLRGGAELLTDAGRTPLRAGERAYASASAAPSTPYVYNSARWDAFDRWSEALRDDRLGASADYLPEEVRPYAASLSQHGRWQRDPTHGYVWYPAVAADWRPYYNGRWVALPSYGWTWVGRDRWAWPTHHYGRWGVSAGVWFWIPGRQWASAWVSWAYAPDYVSWCPLGWNNRPLIQINIFNTRDRWHPWTVVPRRHFGAGFVYARAVSWRDFSDRDRGAFTYRDSAPDYRGYLRGRTAAPIRTAGTRVVGRGGPRGASPLYTNRGAGGTRTAPSSRATVAPDRQTPGSRTSDPARTPNRGGAMRRDGSDFRQEAPSRSSSPATTPRSSNAPGSNVPGARSAEPTRTPVRGGAVRRDGSDLRQDAPSRSASPGIMPRPGTPGAEPGVDGRRGMRSAPRIEERSPQPPPTRTAVPRGSDRPSSSDPAPAWRSRSSSGSSATGRAGERSVPAPPPSDERSTAPPSRAPGVIRRSTEPDDNRGTMRGAPRGGPPGPEYRSPAPAERRPSRGEAPAQARPGGGEPSARPAEPGSRPPAAGARPRSGGDRSSAPSGGRRRGGV